MKLITLSWLGLRKLRKAVVKIDPSGASRGPIRHSTYISVKIHTKKVFKTISNQLVLPKIWWGGQVEVKYSKRVSWCALTQNQPRGVISRWHFQTSLGRRPPNTLVSVGTAPFPAFPSFPAVNRPSHIMNTQMWLTRWFFFGRRWSARLQVLAVLPIPRSSELSKIEISLKISQCQFGVLWDKCIFEINFSAYFCSSHAEVPRSEMDTDKGVLRLDTRWWLQQVNPFLKFALFVDRSRPSVTRITLEHGIVLNLNTGKCLSSLV